MKALLEMDTQTQNFTLLVHGKTIQLQALGIDFVVLFLILSKYDLFPNNVCRFL